MKKSHLFFLSFLSVALICFYFPSFNNFFFQDDFFNMRLSQNHNIFDAFNFFKKPLFDFYFYRPFSTQLYWSLGQTFFGLNPLGYHIVNFFFFIASIFLVYKLTLLVSSDEKVALLTSFFYSFSGSHFYRLFFLSQFQEISLAVFTFATLILFFKKSPWTPLVFALALTTKETAVMIVPFLLLTTLLFKDSKKTHLKLLSVCLVILLIYLLGRFFFFGLPGGDTYTYDFTPKKILNNYFWYSLWSLGLPEAFVNVKFFQLPTIINPQLFTKFESWGNPVLASLGLFLLLIFLSLPKILKKFNKKIIIAIASFTLFLLPVAFFPFHKFPYSLTVPLLGSSILLALMVSQVGKKRMLLICFSYFLLTFTAYQFNLSNHWAVKKAKSAQAIFEFMHDNYPRKPIQSNIYFRNSLSPICVDTRTGPKHSLEVSYSIGAADGLRLYYKDEKLPVYFEDTDIYKHLYSDSLVINARPFYR